MNRAATWWKTAIGLVLTAVMLFPVYWMINVSLHPRPATCARARRTCSRSHGTLEGYRAVLDQQLPYLGTSLLIGLGTVALTVALAAPAGYALAKLRPRGGGALSFVLLIAQMIPGIIMAMGFYAIYLSLGVLNTVPGLIVADSTLAVPFARADLHRVHVRHPRRAAAGRRGSTAPGALRTFWSIVLPVSRNADRHGVAVRLPVGLVGLHLRQHPRQRRRPPADHPRHLPLHRQQQPAVERHHGHRRRRLHPGRACCSSSPSATSPPASPPAPSRTDHPRRSTTATRTRKEPPLHDRRRLRPGVLRPRHPVQLPRLLVRHLPVVAEKTYADDLHLVSHQTGMHAVLRLDPVDASTGEPTVDATPAPLSWTRRRRPDRARLRVADTVRLRGPRPRPAPRWRPRPTLTPFSGTYFYHDPRRRLPRVHLVRDRPPLPDHRARRHAADAVGAAGARQPPNAASTCPATSAWEIAIEEYDTARAPVRAHGDLRAGRRRPARSSTAFADAVAPWRGDRHPGRRTGRLRAVVGDRAPGRASSPGPPC